MHRIFLTAVTLTTVAALVSGCESAMTDPRAPGATLATVATGFGAWSPAVNIEQAEPGAVAGFNTADLDGCPFTSRDGKTFYLASTRPGGLGKIDIWVSHRASPDEPWGPPVNVGAPVNSAEDDFCPTIDRDGHQFFFVSRRTVEGSCGGADIYVTRLRGDSVFEEPRNLGCEVNSGPNSAQDEASPFPLPERASGPVLYFSSTRPGLGAGGDLYRSESHGGVFGVAELVPGVNSIYDDGQPNLRRDGLELFFYSTRPAGGTPDLFVATRPSTSAPWSTPDNLGPNINSAAGETRPSLSWDGTTLYFGSTREGGPANIFVSTRERLAGGSD